MCIDRALNPVLFWTPEISVWRGTMTRLKILHIAMIMLMLLGCLLGYGCGNNETQKTLHVAIYPYVPRPEQFKSVITEEWHKIQPDVQLIWVDTWDGGYSMDPDQSIDVFVFDALYYEYFRTNGYLYSLEKSQVDAIGDFLDYVVQGLTVDNKMYAIPQLGCGDFLFYWKNDAELANAVTISQLDSILGSCTYCDTTPPIGTGLMVDFAGGITDASDYVVSLHETTNQNPVLLPYSTDKIDPVSAKNLQKIMSMSSFNNALYSNDNAPYQRANWFGQGYGRAYVGFMESLTHIDPAKLANIAFKPMPWSDNPTGSQNPLFYSDVIGINATTTSRGTTQLAIKLANLMASADVITRCFGSFGADGPQYLLPVRHSAFTALGVQYPVYRDIYAMVLKVNPTLFDLGSDAKHWLSGMQASLKGVTLADPSCSCERDATKISNYNK
jgi:thiamine pyridinylase